MAKAKPTELDGHLNKFPEYERLCRTLPEVRGTTRHKAGEAARAAQGYRETIDPEIQRLLDAGMKRMDGTIPALTVAQEFRAFCDKFEEISMHWELSQLLTEPYKPGVELAVRGYHGFFLLTQQVLMRDVAVGLFAITDEKGDGSRISLTSQRMYNLAQVQGIPPEVDHAKLDDCHWRLAALNCILGDRWRHKDAAHLDLEAATAKALRTNPLLLSPDICEEMMLRLGMMLPLLNRCLGPIGTLPRNWGRIRAREMLNLSAD